MPKSKSLTDRIGDELEKIPGVTVTRNASIGAGHNNPPEDEEPNAEFSQGRLRSLVKRIEKLMEDRDSVNDDIKEVYAEAKGTGFDTKTIRKVIAERRVEVEKRREQAQLLDLYKSALGMAD